MKPFREPLLAINLLAPKVPTTDENILEAMSKLRYPLWVTTKWDGIRALRFNGSLLSRRLKKIPNPHLREKSLIIPGGMDIELANPSMNFNEVSGIIRNGKGSKEDADKIQFHILDWYKEGNYLFRMNQILTFVREVHGTPNLNSQIKFQFPIRCDDVETLFNYFTNSESNGEEGICFRSPNLEYPQKYPRENRSTLQEQYLIKLTRYTYDEAVIVGFEEQMENGNPEEYSATGKMKRSKDSENMFGKNTLGAYVVMKDGVEFKVSASHSDALRKGVWSNRKKYEGRLLKYKFKGHGTMDKPRHPQFEGFVD